MGGLFGIDVLMSILTGLFFYGSLVAVIFILKKLSKDVAELKQSVSSLQELILQLPRPEPQAK
jgi:hypothetical protein